MNKRKENIEKAARLIEDADAILIGAGAGMGVDSGLPDFRGNEGFWNEYPPYKKLGLDFYQMANPEGFLSNPSFAWGFYGHRLNLYRETVPHIGFTILKKWGERKKDDFFIFTSNVDGQFHKSGFPEDKIEECHGSIHFLQCSSSCSGIWSNSEAKITVDKSTMIYSGDLPLCAKCGSVARPNILMFGDWNWIPDRTNHQHKKMLKWQEKLIGKKLIIIECGAGTSIPTVRSISEKFLRTFNSTLVRINMREAQVTFGNIGFFEGAKKTIEDIESVISGKPIQSNLF